MRLRVPIAIVCLLGIPADARSWHLPEHRALTRAALAAHPDLPESAKAVVRGAILEDLDPGKALRWSHYYAPAGADHGRRRRSGERVEFLWAKIERDLGRGADRKVWRRTGRIVHHVQ